jgi:hypothetical protein
VHIVLKRCAIIIIVRLEPYSMRIFSIASWTSFSDLLSNALVASSSIKILGFLIKALAIAIRCFYPPLRFITLPAPT